MLRKTFYISIGILIVAICAVALLKLHSDMPSESIKIYKAVDTKGATVSSDAVFVSDVLDAVETPMATETSGFPYLTETRAQTFTHPHRLTSDEEYESESDDKQNAAARMNLAQRLGMSTVPLPTIEEITAEVEKREAEVAMYERLSQELEPILSATLKIEDAAISDYVNMLPILSMTYDEFHETYPTVVDRREVAAMFMKIEGHRADFVALIENASPQLREEFYNVMSEEGLLEQYQLIQKPAPFVEWMDDLISEHADFNGGIPE